MKSIFLSALLLIAFFSCKKNDPTPETITFANSIKIVPNKKQIAVGDTFTLNAFYYNNKNEIEAVPITWEISDTTVALLSANSLVTGIKEGFVSFKAKYGSLAQATSSITVSGFAASITKRTGKISGKNNHVATGTVTLEQIGAYLEIVFESDYSSQSGPELILYLSNEEKVVSSSLNIAPIAQLSGKHSYKAPLGTNINDFNYVIIHCKPYNITFAAAELK